MVVHEVIMNIKNFCDKHTAKGIVFCLEGTQIVAVTKMQVRAMVHVSQALVYWGGRSELALKGCMRMG